LKLRRNEPLTPTDLAELERIFAEIGANAYPGPISIPKEIRREQRRVGMPGTATVFADRAGPIGVLMSILVWISWYTAHL
jgi:hypothetical protein